MTRSDYLTHHWKAYPALPFEDSGPVKFRGRLQDIHRTESDIWSVSVLQNGQARTEQFSKLSMADFQDCADGQLLQVLKAQDLIAIDGRGSVTLLAPHKTRLPARDYRPKRLKLWQEYLYWLREFFRSQGFLELATPSLVTCPGTEPTLDPFSTELVIGTRRESKFLPTSPELHLKKALALGAENIFEIRSCFRNGEVTEHHQPEFTMIEWYRAYEGLSSIQQDVEKLVHYLAEKVPGLRKPAGVKSCSVAQLFKEYYDGFPLLPQTSFAELRTLALKRGVDISSATTIDDGFFLLFLEIEKNFEPEQMNFVELYPPYQAALARVTPDGWGERFEVYWQGLELANAFHELNDPVVQAARFQQDADKKKALGKTAVPLDHEFMECLEAGMPPTSGIALGVERLFMAMTGLQKISETRLFPMK